jgi:hypothetical protein
VLGSAEKAIGICDLENQESIVLSYPLHYAHCNRAYKKEIRGSILNLMDFPFSLYFLFI